MSYGNQRGTSNFFCIQVQISNRGYQCFDRPQLKDRNFALYCCTLYMLATVTAVWHRNVCFLPVRTVSPPTVHGILSRRFARYQEDAMECRCCLLSRFVCPACTPGFCSLRNVLLRTSYHDISIFKWRQYHAYDHLPPIEKG